MFHPSAFPSEARTLEPLFLDRMSWPHDGKTQEWSVRWEAGEGLGAGWERPSREGGWARASSFIIGLGFWD